MQGFADVRSVTVKPAGIALLASLGIRLRIGYLHQRDCPGDDSRLQTGDELV
jgi:hypothetical protein